MSRKQNARETVLKASRAYYGHVAFYEDLIAQRSRQITKARKRELDFLEFAFRTHASHQVKDVLDVACGNGPHVIGLAHRGYKCTGLDYTPERVQIAKARAKREGVTVKLLQRDATKLKYKNQFDGAIALYILFLLPNDDDVQKCLQQIHQALRPGGTLVCNIGNPFSDSNAWFSLKTIHQGGNTQETRAPGMRFSEINRVLDFDPVHGVAWWQETSIIEAPDGAHVFRDRERTRLFTYWDILHYLQAAGFKDIKWYPDWKHTQPKKPKGTQLIFVSRKD